MQITKDAEEMLEMWKTAYMDTRHKIEVSGKGQRWEFDKQKLFSESDYVASVCKNLYEVAAVFIIIIIIYFFNLKGIVQ